MDILSLKRENTNAAGDGFTNYLLSTTGAHAMSKGVVSTTFYMSAVDSLKAAMSSFFVNLTYLNKTKCCKILTIMQLNPDERKNLLVACFDLFLSYSLQYTIYRSI